MLKINKINIIIFLGFLISVLISINNLNKYDKNVTDENGNTYHQMIKYDAYRYLSHGDKIKDQLKEGLNFFETGKEHYTKYLPPRVMAIYYYLFDIDLYENSDKKKINTGIHLPYLIFQSLLYYFSVLLLYFSLSKIINNKISFFILVFLCFEPTILQYHSSFWSESIFFSLQIIIISLILKKKQSNLNFFLTGFFLALLSFQKEYSIFYIIPIIIYSYITANNFKYKSFILMLVGFFLVQSFLVYNNYKRSGQFYIMTADSKVNLHIDLVRKVMQKKLKMSGNEFDIIEGKASIKWINENSIQFNKEKLSNINSPGFMDYRDSILEKDKVKFDNFIRNRTADYFFEYPIDFLKFIIKSSVHITLLNPFHIYSDNNFISGEYYYTTDTHDKLVPYRIFYTVLIYIVCIYGLYASFRMKDYNILFYLVISIVYFYSLVSWHGNTRYFMPVVIYLSFFFGYGIDAILKLKKNKLIL